MLFIYATKERQPLIRSDVEQLVYDHIKEQLIETGCKACIINGMQEHIHLLFLLKPF